MACSAGIQERGAEGGPLCSGLSGHGPRHSRPGGGAKLLGTGAEVALVLLAPAISKRVMIEVAPDFPVDGRAVTTQSLGDCRHRHLGVAHVLDAAALGKIDLRIMFTRQRSRLIKPCDHKKVALQNRTYRAYTQKHIRRLMENKMPSYATSHKKALVPGQFVTVNPTPTRAAVTDASTSQLPRQEAFLGIDGTKCRSFRCPGGR